MAAEEATFSTHSHHPGFVRLRDKFDEHERHRQGQGREDKPKARARALDQYDSTRLPILLLPPQTRASAIDDRDVGNPAWSQAHRPLMARAAEEMEMQVKLTGARA